MENNTTMKDVTQDFILVKGDISGIQEFIFNVKSNGAAKSLKGRSFFMKVLTETAIQYLFDKFKVDLNERACFRISTSGGNFFLKLPRIENHEKNIRDFQLLLSKSLQFSGINLAINYVNLDINNYSKCLEKLNKKVRRSRLKLFYNLDENDFNLLFQPKDRQKYRDIEDNDKWSHITLKLRSSKYFSIIKGQQPSDDLQITNDIIELIGYRCEFHNDPYRLPKIELKDYLESIFPLKHNSKNPKEFEDLANPYNRNSGASKLGILKMDVDNLGSTLEKVNSIEEHRKFDNQLNTFFNFELRKLIDRRQFQNNIYTVTTGGDDSFFVGHWRTILEFGEKINKEFCTYFNKRGKKLTISAGYIIVPPKFPVIRFAQLAEEALHNAKYKYNKGNICLFDEVISWETFNKIQLFKNQLDKSVDNKSKGLLTKARQSAIRGIEDNKISMKENWEIAYYLRNVKDRKLVEKIRKNITDSTNKRTQQLKRNLRLILPIAARLTELEKR